MEKNSKILLLFTSINYKPLSLKLAKLHRKEKKKRKAVLLCVIFQPVNDALQFTQK